VPYSEQDKSIYWSLRNWPYEIQNAEEEGKKGLNNQESKFQDVLENEKESFLNDLKLLLKQFNTIKTFNNYSQVKAYAVEIASLKE